VRQVEIKRYQCYEMLSLKLSFLIAGTLLEATIIFRRSMSIRIRKMALLAYLVMICGMLASCGSDALQNLHMLSQEEAYTVADPYDAGWVIFSAKDSPERGRLSPPGSPAESPPEALTETAYFA
jgi:hypothetical protein